MPTRLARSRARGPRNWFDKTSNIELRRFAGTLRHAQQLTTPLRIAHVTDQHVGRVTPMRVQMAAVELINERRPDLVCVTGDFVCHSQAYLDALEEVIAAFEAPVVGVLGNHDHWSGADAVRRILRRAGCEVLDNVHTVITLRHQRLQLVGLDDAYTGHADWRSAVKGLRPDLPTLGLSHIAEECERLWGAGVPLVLSGHTHAGQVTLARLNELALGKLVGHKYVHGLYGSRLADAPHGSVYVGAGIGAAVIPVRLGKRARREVTLFDLGLEPGAFDEHHAAQAALPGRPPSDATKARRARKVAKRKAKRALRGEEP
ncbi:MAG: metallophosphoesterase family protein [Myxococcales bacterium]|nr:metallophosphoesterase family protein [Myxococcales bacterium]